MFVLMVTRTRHPIPFCLSHGPFANIWPSTPSFCTRFSLSLPMLLGRQIPNFRTCQRRCRIDRLFGIFPTSFTFPLFLVLMPGLSQAQGI